MILRNYLFSKEYDTYQQYPNDIAKQFLNQITSNQLSADQIVIHRDGNLIYYAYIHCVSVNKVFGHCIVTGDVCIKIQELYDLFHKSIEQAALKGVLFSFDPTGEISRQTRDFSEEGAEVNEFFKDFNSIAGKESYWKSIGSIDFSVSKDSKLYLSLTDDSNEKIVEAIEHYHNVIITIENPIASSYSNIVKQLNLDKDELINRIGHLSNENDELLKKKKQYKAVVTLFVIIILCCIGLLSFYREITGKTQHIQELENEITIKRDSLLLQNNEINRLVDDLSSTNRRLSSVQSELSDYKDKVGKHMPLVINNIELANYTANQGRVISDYGQRIYSNESRWVWFRINYDGIVSGTKNLYYKVYDQKGQLETCSSSPSGYSWSSDIYIYGDNNNSVVLFGWGADNASTWSTGTYRIEIWYNDMCLKAKSFTIY